MKKSLILDNMLKQQNGYLKTADVVACGISKSYLSEYVRKNGLIRVAHGVYADSDIWPDELYLISVRNQRTCFSHETALYLHGLMEHEPSGITVTVREGYNATHLKKQGITSHKVKRDIYELGMSEVETPYGNRVRAYNRERTICDIIKAKPRMDIQVFQAAMKEYMAGADRDISALIRYARATGVEEQVRIYIEVMI